MGATGGTGPSRWGRRGQVVVASSVARAVRGGDGGGDGRKWKEVRDGDKWGNEGKEKGQAVSKSPYVRRWSHHRRT
jgi:hypothetical protein